MARGKYTKFSDDPTVEQIMRAGEAAFSTRDFDEALNAYAKALELEPTNYPAILFTGNTYERQNDFARAGIVGDSFGSAAEVAFCSIR